MSGEEARTFPERIWAGHLGGGRRIWKPELAHEDEKAFACEYVRADLASDLLEALEELVSITDRDHCAWDRARAVIAAATGQPTATEPARTDEDSGANKLP